MRYRLYLAILCSVMAMLLDFSQQYRTQGVAFGELAAADPAEVAQPRVAPAVAQWASLTDDPDVADGAWTDSDWDALQLENVVPLRGVFQEFTGDMIDALSEAEAVNGAAVEALADRAAASVPALPSEPVAARFPDLTGEQAL